MTVDDPLNDGEANPGAFEFLRGMQALERSEQPLRVLQIKTHSIVSDEAGRQSLLFEATEFDLRVRSLRGKFPRISDQILEGDLKKTLVAVDEGVFLDRELVRPRPCAGMDV